MTWVSPEQIVWWRWATDQRRGMLTPKSSDSSAAASAVLVLRQVRNWASWRPSALKAR